MAIETNGTTRVPLIKDPAKVFDIFNANDLLKAAGLTSQITAPDGVSRTPLLEGTKYIIHTSFVWPKILIPENTAGGASSVDIVGANSRTPILLNGSNDGIAIFWGRDVNQLTLIDLVVVDVGNTGSGQSATVFNMVGGVAPSRITFVNTTFSRPADMGAVSDFTITFNPNVNFVSIGRGLVSDMSPETISPGLHSLLGMRCINALALTSDGPYLGFTGAQETMSINSSNINFTANDEFLRLDENVTGSWDIVGNAYNGVGDFLSTGNVATNTLYANANLVIDSFSDSTVDPGVDTTVNLAVITKFKVGQTILIADEAAYDGEHVIVRVASDQLSFDINVVFSTSGAGTLNQTRITSTSHGFMLNENMTITGVAIYNGDHVVNQIVDNDTYEIPFAFDTAETTGTATSISKTEVDEGVESEINGEATSSKRIAAGVTNGNVQTTTFSTADEYIGMNLGVVIDDELITERFTLVNDTIGIYSYDDPRPITVRVDAIAWIVKTVSTKNYRFALSKNSEVSIFTTTITSVTDSSGLARFNFTPGPTPTVGQKVIVKNYTTNTDYNGTFIITAAGAGYFETGVDFGADEAGGEFENAYSIAEVKTTSVMTAFSEFIDLVQNDTLRIRIAPDGHTDTCTITDFKLSITGI